MAMILLLGLLSLIQLRDGYQQLKDTLALISGTSKTAEVYPLVRNGLIAVQGQLLLAPYAELYILSYTEVNADHIKEKIALGSTLMHFVPIAPVVYRQAFFLAQDGQLEQARQVLEQAIWSYPGVNDMHQMLVSLAEKDPEHFSALLKFADLKEQEHARAVHK